MTILDDAPELATDALTAVDADETPPVAPEIAEPPADDRPSLAEILRPILAATFATLAAGLLIAGIFDSWSARAIATLGAVIGPAWAAGALRSPRTWVAQLLLPPALLVVSVLVLALLGGAPGELPGLVGDALESGRLLRPPVPFDPGWGPILVTVVALLGFASAWVATTFDRPMLAVAIPLPVIALTAISQPDDAQLIAGLSAFVPILAALAVLFGGDSAKADALGTQFEIKRALKGLAGVVPVVAVLVALNSASFLFPEPVYDPTDRPQKPKAVPLSAAEDRVLFEVATESNLTGPWRTGVLDVYDDDDAWKLPPYNKGRLEPLPADGSLSELRATDEQLTVTLTVRDLGDSAVLPMLATVTTIDLQGADVVVDPRTELLRVPQGRVPAGVVYTVRLPAYPSSEQLSKVPPTSKRRDLADQLDAPNPPAVVESLLSTVSDSPWARVDILRKKLLSEVTASGAGAPVDVPPSKVVDLLEGSKQGSPFEIVAAEALLARWAGVPARVGFGFDGLNIEGDLLTVRPKNSAQWLEVWFDGYGWVPLIGHPEKAETKLDSDPNARFNPTILPSDDVAVEVYLPFELEDLELLYQRLRALVFTVAPFLAVALGTYYGWPAVAKVLRRERRRRWASARGPQAPVAVEYAELRDLAIDLNVGDEWDTPLEWLRKVVPDEEHEELAWLASRALYGDMRDTVTAEDADNAERLAASLRRRLSRGQATQTRVLAAIGRASLERPFTREMPNVRQLRLPRPRLPRLRIPRPRVRLPGGAR